MTHAVHPYSFRLGVIRDWKSRWFSLRDYRKILKGDVLLREWLKERLRGFYIGGIEIERSPAVTHITFKTSRPGLLIGRGGESLENLRKEIIARMRRWKISLPRELKLSVEEIHAPETNAAIAAQMIADDLKKRLPFRRVMKKMVSKIMANKGVEGVKIGLYGRLGGAEMARRETLMYGKVPLNTLRADIDFARERANLPYGDIGIKVWIYKGEIFDK